MRVLLTGATGYVGGRLTPRLLEAGHEVTVLVRDARRFDGRPGAEGVGVIEADLLERASLGDRLRGFDAAYYLVHSMTAGRSFDELDNRAAVNFAEAIGDETHAIYLGGLLPEGPGVSKHLRSRAETGRVLRERLPGRVSEFRAGPVIGSGSASFEMVRYLTERLPLMVTPRWVRNAVQPIAVRDVMAYLLGALDTGPCGVVEVGADRLTFQQMMEVYAEQRGLSRRLIVPTPFLAPGLAARWVGFFTPVPNRLAVPLVQGLIQPLLADTGRARELFPLIEPISYARAVALALERTEKNLIETRWSGALGAEANSELVDEEGLMREVRMVDVDALPGAVFRAFSTLGGDQRWLVWNWAWSLRGWIDKLVGGPGLRRGRRDPVALLEGETVDFWRVERVEPGVMLRLRAEMKLPGRAWLQWEATELEAGVTRLTQIALFEPKGLWGVVYWYALVPWHALIFGGMARAIAKRARLG